MGIETSDIQLSEPQRRLLAEVADRAGKPWSQVLQEALCEYGARAAVAEPDSGPGKSWLDALSQHGLVGCLHGGPPDLSTNPVYMEGFAEDRP